MAKKGKGDKIRRDNKHRSERKRSEEALRLSEAKLSGVMMMAKIGHWEYDVAANLFTFNDNFYAIFGTTAAEVGGYAMTPKEYSDHFLHPDDREIVFIETQKALETTDPNFTQSLDHRIILPDGTTGYISVRIFIVKDERGNTVKTYGFNQNITERKRVEEALREKNAELNDFAVMASHDLKEPLRKISLLGERLQDDYRTTLDERGRDFLERIRASALRMQNLIDDLLAYTRIATDAIPWSRVDLSRTLQDVLADLEARIEKTAARVEVAPLPVIEAEPVQMRQLFQNLIGNALKFHNPGRAPVIRVTPFDPKAAGQCGIVVNDEGIGISPDHFERIFRAFQRLHSYSQYEGSGIGLAICKRIIERHRGTIRVESAPGRGTKFFVTLPVKQAARES